VDLRSRYRGCMDAGYVIIAIAILIVALLAVRSD
jgi:hypothetical protein